ncbi:MAG: hypothetical protein C6W54_01420 [Bacillaceae bacterium]|nr:MAG: hypothetical protein C6W54_01420 [Bacillaceae bacterium]
MCRLSSEIMPLEAPCQDTPDLPFANFEVTHKDVIGVAQNSIIKSIIKKINKNLYGNKGNDSQIV